MEQKEEGPKSSALHHALFLSIIFVNGKTSHLKIYRYADKKDSNFRIME